MTKPTPSTPNRLRLTASQQSIVLLAIAGLCVLLALWMGWNGWHQQQHAGRGQALLQVRDNAAKAVGASLSKQLQHLQAQLATPALKAAIDRGDLKAAGIALADDWRAVEHAEVVEPDFAAAYKGLAEGGYGRLAALEAARVADAAVAMIVRDEGKPQLAITAPVRADKKLVGVAYAQLPMAMATSALSDVQLYAGSYLALRQGHHAVMWRGDPALSDHAKAMSTNIPGSQLQIVAAQAEIAPGPFGLGSLGCFIAAGVLVLFAVLAGVLAQRRRHVDDSDTDHEVAAEPTLSEALEPVPAKVAATAAFTGLAGARGAGQPANVVTPAPEDIPATEAIDRSIFRAYDIRGVVGQTLDRDVAELIGRSIGSLMQDKGLNDIAVGRDGRLSGPDMVAGLIAGLRRAGRNVIDIGMAPTPVVYFAAYHLQTGSCVSVTGSHNPPDYNGFKIVIGGETLSGDAITDLYARIARETLHEASTQGALQQRNVDDDYIRRIAEDIQLDRRLRVVVDAGNGVAGEIAPKVLAAIGANVTPLYCEIDGTFPNHHPDPSEPKNLADLIQTVQRLDADLGVAFDGDGDRLGVVTRDGNNIFADRLLMLFAADVLERNPGAMIVYDVKCTGRLPGHILRHGGSPLMWKTGHSLIKAKMRETEAELAGEMSGHFFFKERWYGFDDGIYAAARLLEILATNRQSPSAVLNALPDGVSTPEIKVDAPDGDPHAFVERFLATATFEGARLSTIDGLRVDWPDGWGLVRASNTTPVLVMRFDADSREALTRIQSEFRRQLLALKPDMVLPF